MTHKRWRVEVSEITGDRDTLVAVLAEHGFALDDGILLSDKFEAMDTASEVHAAATVLSQQINRISAVRSDVDMTFRVGSVREETEGGENKIAFGVAHISIGSPTAAATVEVIDGLSEEERAELALLRRIDAASRVLDAVIADEDVLAILKLLDGAPTGNELGHVADIIKDNLGGDASALVSTNRLERFYRSINHPAVLGLNACHVQSREEPPPNPMTLKEANRFAKGLAESYIDYLNWP